MTSQSDRERFEDQYPSTTGTGQPSSSTGQSGSATVREKISNATDKAGDVAERVGERVNRTGEQAADKVNQGMTAAGEKISDLAQTVRERAPGGDVTNKAADALERSGQYLQDADLDAVRSDLEGVIRDHPLESILVGLGVGFLIGRTMMGGRR